jgi:hypothetical protein
MGDSFRGFQNTRGFGRLRSVGNGKQVVNLTKVKILRPGWLAYMLCNFLENLPLNSVATSEPEVC